MMRKTEDGGWISNAIFCIGGYMHYKNLEAMGWIPVKLRLPKSTFIQVLITNGKFVSVSRARILTIHPDVATHWMPLARNTKANQRCHRQKNKTMGIAAVPDLISEYISHYPESNEVPGS